MVAFVNASALVDGGGIVGAEPQSYKSERNDTGQPQWSTCRVAEGVVGAGGGKNWAIGGGVHVAAATEAVGNNEGTRVETSLIFYSRLY